MDEKDKTNQIPVQAILSFLASVISKHIELLSSYNHLVIHLTIMYSSSPDIIRTLIPSKAENKHLGGFISLFIYNIDLIIWVSSIDFFLQIKFIRTELHLLPRSYQPIHSIKHCTKREKGEGENKQVARQGPPWPYGHWFIETNMKQQQK